MKIITLIENTVSSGDLQAEHGLSIYIETDKRKILFDTGRSGLFIQNAERLGVIIEEIDFLVLSHGHNDHTGGLYPFLEKNSKAKVFAKKNIFIPKYKGNTHFIGTPSNASLLNDRLVFVERLTELGENIFIVPDILLTNKVDTHFKNFTTKTNGNYMPDEFDDELFMAIKSKNQINILTACSHRGITNICKTATEHFKLPLGTILGGFHMKDSTVEQYIQIADYFRISKPESIGACHCTGIEKFAVMYNEIDSHVFYNHTGQKIEI